MAQSLIVASEAQLKIVDPVKAQKLQRTDGISVFRNRNWDGFRQNHRDNCFAFYEVDGRELLRIEPRYYTENPSVMLQKCKIENFLAVGRLNPEKLVFASFSVDQSYLIELVARAWGATHSTDWQLIQFADASVVIDNSESVIFGRLFDLVDQYGLEIQY